MNSKQQRIAIAKATGWKCSEYSDELGQLVAQFTPAPDPDQPCQATPAGDLRQQIMDSRVPKNEREWWASREIEKLERELVEARSERDLAITRVACILWSGAIDKHTCGDVQKWADYYTAELTRLRADLERFTGHGLLDCHAICDQRDTAVAERDRLRAEVERWKTVAAEMSQQREHNANEASRLRAERAELKLEKMATALADCISTFRSDDKTTIITAERQEAWRAALLSYKPDHTFT